MDLIKKNSMEMRSTALFVFVALILLSFFLVRAGKSFDCITEKPSADTAVMLSSGEVLRQDIPTSITDISSVDILFGTYGRENEGELIVTLYEDGNVVEEWDCDTVDIADGVYHRFELTKTCHLSDGHDYCFTVENTYDGDNALAVWTPGTDDAAGKICYRLVYPDLNMKLIVTIASLVLFAVTVLLVILPVDERIIMTVVLAGLAAAYLLICPLGMAPDERNHFYRAFEIAHGNLTSRNLGADGGGNVLPAALESFKDANAVLDWNNTAVLTFPNTSLYSPVSYLPQAVGIKIAELFTDRAYYIFLGGRIAGAVVSIALSAVSIWLIPFGRKIMFMVMLFPLTLQEMISMAPDGFTISLAMFLFAYVLHLRYREGKIRKMDYSVLAVICILLSLCKIVYVVLVLLVLLIPKEKFKHSKGKTIFNIAMLLSSVGVNLIWLSICSKYLIEFQPGVDTSAQILGILSNPFGYYMTVVRTLTEYGDFYINTMIGSYMGALNIKITAFVWVLYLVVFVSMIAGSRERIPDIRKWDKYILFFVFLCCSALIVTSEYVQWTSVGNSLIIGIQGRYFIPLITLLAFAVMYCIREHKSRAADEFVSSPRGSYYYILLLMFNGITILDIIHYYNYYSI